LAGKHQILRYRLRNIRGAKSTIVLVAAFLIAAVAVVAFVAHERFTTARQYAAEHSGLSGQVAAALAVRTDDHVRGSSSAPVTLIEYSDTECKFCKRLHSTLDALYGVYGTSGEVRFVYRHFPLGIWRNSLQEAVALECAALLGGAPYFFSYLDALFAASGSEDTFDLARLPELAQGIGLEHRTFNECLNSQRFIPRIERDRVSGKMLGVSKTPTVIIVSPDGTTLTIVGNKSYNLLDAAIRAALARVSS
jgi:protein-disulfide isomerase